MATLGGYAQRQSQTASAADTTLQALMMLMQYQQQSEDRRLSREQMQLQSEQLRGLLRAQQREEVAQTPGTTAIRNISDVENQSVYSRLDQTIDSLRTFMDNPELASDPVLNAELGLSPAVRSMRSGSPEEYAKIIRVLNTQLEQVQSMIDSSEVPPKERQRFMESLKGRIKDLGNNISEGVKFQQGYLQTLVEDNARSGTGLLVSESVENPSRLIPEDPLVEVFPATVNSFGKQAAEAGVRAVSEPVVDAAINNLSEEDARTLQQQIEEDPSLIETIGLAENATKAVEDIIGNIPPAQESLIDRAVSFAQESPGTAAVGTLGAGYGLSKLWPLLRQSPAVAAALTGAEALGRAGQEQGLLPGEGVFVGDDSMMQGSMRDISQAQELQQRLPEDQRVGPIEGVLRGMGEATYDALDTLGLMDPMGPLAFLKPTPPAPQTAAAPAEGVIEKEVVRRDFGAEIPEQVTLEDLVAPAPAAAQYDPLDIEMQPSEIPAQADPGYIDDLTNLQFQASMHKAIEANRELAALVGLARETNAEQNLTFQAYEVDPNATGADRPQTAEQYLAGNLNQAIADNPDIGFADDGSLVESLEARQKRMASKTNPDNALGRRSLLKNQSLEDRQARMAQTNEPETPLGARSALALNPALSLYEERVPAGFTPLSEEEYQSRQLMAEMLNQSAIDNMIETTRREQQAQALLSQLVAEQPVYNTAPQMDQMQIQHLLQATPNTGLNLPFNPRSLYALMGQPF